MDNKKIVVNNLFLDGMCNMLLASIEYSLIFNLPDEFMCLLIEYVIRLCRAVS